MKRIILIVALLVIAITVLSFKNLTITESTYIEPKIDTETKSVLVEIDDCPKSLTKDPSRYPCKKLIKTKIGTTDDKENVIVTLVEEDSVVTQNSGLVQSAKKGDFIYTLKNGNQYVVGVNRTTNSK